MMISDIEKKQNDVNNFIMATGLSREREKQKNDLIFKYVKSMNSFNGDGEEDLSRSRVALEKYYKRMALEDKQKSIDIRSKVYELTIKSGSSKKVKFLNDVIVNNGQNSEGMGTNCITQGHKKDGIVTPNPEDIKKDLEDLQRSVFSVFKIKSEGYQNHRQPQRMLESMPVVSSLMLESRIEGNKAESKLQVSHSKKDKLYCPSPKMLRSHSEVFTSSRTRQNVSSNSHAKKPEKSDSRASKTTNRVNLGRNMSESQLSRGTSGSYYDLIKRGPNPSVLTSNSSTLCRSDSFWKQQNNLMVQIFKSKLSFSGKK